MQETRLIENEYSVNLPTLFRYQGRTWQGWLNIPAVFRAVAVIGSPGSGKSFTVINNFIRQFIEKSFCLYIYDFKYPDLSTLAYNHLLRYKDRYEVTPQFCVINFDDPRHSHRCNPLKAEFLTDIADSYEAANVTMLGLNRSWSQKQGDFFIESSVILFAAIIWFLKIYENGKYCTFPHAVELLMQKYEEVFTILMAGRNWRDMSAPLWMLGSPGPWSSLPGRSQVQRSHFRGLSRRRSTGLCPGTIFRSTSTTRKPRKSYASATTRSAWRYTAQPYPSIIPAS